jgi:membrane protein YdbS with pleckstrin-like domain
MEMSTGEERILFDLKPSPAFRNPMMVVTLGLYWFWYQRTVYHVTEKHLRMHRGILSRNEDEVPLVRLAAVKMKLSPLFGNSSVEAATGAGEHTVTVEHMNRKDARAFANALNKARAEARERMDASPSSA